MARFYQMIILSAVMFMLLSCGVVWANTAPTVSQVSVSQRTDGSGIVDIYYTLNDADGDNCTVDIEVSDDGGSSWDVTATALSGDIGAGISPGRRHIIWNSKTDLPGEYGTNYCVEVTAGLKITNLSPSSYVVSYNDLNIGELTYIDRAYTFTNVASFGGATYIKTANNDKYLTASSFMTFDINKACTVYVAHDDGVYPKPAWMSTFTDTGENLHNSGSTNTFSLYFKNFNAGTVTLGGNAGGVGSGMYTVVVVPSFVISSVSPATYTVRYDSLAFGQLVYIDRTYTFTNVASFGGATYIKTANDDKYLTASSFMTFDINKACTVYVAHDDGVYPKPAWMSTFTDTGENLTNNGSTSTFSVYSKDFSAGTVTLGGNAGGAGSMMYTVLCNSTYAEQDVGYSNIFMIDNRDSGDGPLVTAVSSPYCSQTKKAYFLSGVSLNQTFTATIDWNELTASHVKWYRNTTLIATDTVSGNSVSRTFNVGTEFNIGEQLYVQAVATDGTASAKTGANFDVVSPPPGLVAGILFFQNDVYKSFPFNIGFPELKKDAPPLTDKNKIAEIAQVDWTSIIEVTAEIDLNGHAEIKSGTDYIEDDFKLCGLEINGNLKVVMSFDYISSQWKFGGGFDLSIFKDFTATPTYVVFMVGPVPVPTYYGFAIDAHVSANCRFTDGSVNNPVFSGDIPITAGVEGIAGVGIANCLSCEGYLGGGLNFDFQVPQQPYLRDWSLSLNGGIRIYLVFYKYENNFLSYRWPEEEGAMAFGMKALAVENFEPMSRDYLTADYAQWHGDLNAMKTLDIEQLGAGGTETTLQTNIFGQSNVVLAVSDSTKCLVWLYDEPSRNSLDRTMLVYSINEGSGWSAPVAVDDDGTADAMPALAVDASGNFVCVWANASQLIPDGTNLAGFADKLDIQMAVYDGGTDIWTSEIVANASALDYNPRVACEGSGDITVVWTHDDNNDMLAENPPVSNTLLARTKTGTGWESAQTLTAESGLVKYSDMESDAANSYIVYGLDSDSNLETDGDNELYYINNVGGTWLAPIRLTNDPNADVNPQLIRTSTDMMLLWAKDGTIVSTTDIAGMTGITEVVAQQGSSGQRSFVAAVSPTDNISVIWNDPSAEGSDIYTATYDPTVAAWSAVVQVTDNRDMERSITAAYSADDTLDLAYNKVQIVEGEGLNVFGQVDLCAYEYVIGTDFTVTVESIHLSDPDAVPGDTVTLQATIANIGDTAIDNIPVAFYCGESAEPANQIGSTQIISSALAAGHETVVSVSWTIPESDEPLNVIVVIDPDLQIEDKDRQNNSASVEMFGANISIGNVDINNNGFGDNFYISANIVNTGFIPLPDGITIQLTGADDESIVFDNQPVSALDVGQSHTVTLTAAAEQLGYGFNLLKLNVDPSDVVNEVVEIDNIRNVIINNVIPYDLVIDGVIDLLDLCVLAEQWLSTTGDLTADIAPYGGDGTVNLLDFSMLIDHWQEIVGFYDILQDGVVDVQDLQIMAEQWLDVPGTPSADIAPSPRDGIVNLIDFAALAQHWLEGTL